jgi:hypothetical protein
VRKGSTCFEAHSPTGQVSADDPLRQTRRLTADCADIPDWSANPRLENGLFETHYPLRRVEPHHLIRRHTCAHDTVVAGLTGHSDRANALHAI